MGKKKRPKLQRARRLICSAGRAAQLERREREHGRSLLMHFLTFGDDPILTVFCPLRLLSWRRGGDVGDV